MNDKLSEDILLKQTEIFEIQEKEQASSKERDGLIEEINRQRLQMIKDKECWLEEEQKRTQEKEKFYNFQIKDREAQVRLELNKTYTIQLKQEVQGENSFVFIIVW
jgi:hypothetical protein